jgi:hypothetical protein
MEHALGLHRPALIVVFAIVVLGALFYGVTSRRRSDPHLDVGNRSDEAINRPAGVSDDSPSASSRPGASDRTAEASDRSPAA